MLKYVIQWATPSAAGPLNAATFNWLLVLRLLRLLDFADNVKMAGTMEIDAANFDWNCKSCSDISVFFELCSMTL